MPQGKYEAALDIIGALIGWDEYDPNLRELAEKVLWCERQFPGTVAMAIRVAKARYSRDFPMTPEILLEGAKLAAIERIEETGLSSLYTSDLRRMELDEDFGHWGEVKTYSSYCQETQ